MKEERRDTREGAHPCVFIHAHTHIHTLALTHTLKLMEKGSGEVL